MSEIIETAGNYRVRLEIQQDSGSFNPREDYDHVTYAVTVPHSRYMDVVGAGPLADGWDRIKDRYAEAQAVAIFERWARTFHGATTLFHSPHVGPNSVWYILPEQIKEIGGTPEEALKAEIQEYQAWAEGEVYGYIIEKSVTWVRKDDPNGDELTTWEEEESCWGLIGRKWAEEATQDAFAAYKNES